MMVYKLSQEAVDMLLQTPLEVLVEKTKEANQAIFVDNQFEDLLKVAAIATASPSAIDSPAFLAMPHRRDIAPVATIGRARTTSGHAA